MAKEVIIKFTIKKTAYYYMSFVFAFFESIDLLRAISEKPILKLKIGNRSSLIKLNDLSQFKNLMYGQL